MKLHFDSNQEYQIEAIRAVTDIFEGKPLSGGDFEFSLTQTGALLSENGVGNSRILTEEQIWENVISIQLMKTISRSSHLLRISLPKTVRATRTSSSFSSSLFGSR